MKRILASMVFILAPVTVSASPILYTSESAFLTAAGAPAMESFEGLALANNLSAVVAPDFTMAGSPASLDVRNTSLAGSHATDGVQFVRSDNGTVVLTFDFLINWFGIMLTDLFDSTSATLSISTNSGAIFPNALMGPRPDGAEDFLGLFHDIAFTTVTLVDSGIDGVGFDEVRYLASPTEVPEPATLFLLAVGLAGFVALGSARKPLSRAQQ
jgi:hypothetical protein